MEGTKKLRDTGIDHGTFVHHTSSGVSIRDTYANDLSDF